MFKLFGTVYLCLSLEFFLSCPHLNEWAKGAVYLTYRNRNTDGAAESFFPLVCLKFSQSPPFSWPWTL